MSSAKKIRLAYKNYQIENFHKQLKLWHTEEEEVQKEADSAVKKEA